MIDGIKFSWDYKNLDVVNFRNGDAIYHAMTAADWQDCSVNAIAAWCDCGFEKLDNHKFGKFYNWHALVDLRGLAPTGWKIPTERDWQFFFESQGGHNNSIDMQKNEGGGILEPKWSWYRFLRI